MRTIKTSAVKFGIKRLILLVFRWGVIKSFLFDDDKTLTTS
jgi:hypothetical protein